MTTIKEVCQDVIDRVKLEKIYPATNYIIDKNKLSKFDNDSSAQEALQKITCLVCAKGALLTSWILKENNFSVGQLLDIVCGDEQLIGWPKELVELFGVQLLNEIEIAFESKIFTFHYDGVGFLEERAKELMYKYDHLNFADRLIEIMTDVINDKF